MVSSGSTIVQPEPREQCDAVVKPPKRERRSGDDYRDDIVLTECGICQQAVGANGKLMNLERLLSIQNAPVKFYACSSACLRMFKSEKLSAKKQKAALTRVSEWLTGELGTTRRKGDEVYVLEDKSPGKIVEEGSGTIRSLSFNADLNKVVFTVSMALGGTSVVAETGLRGLERRAAPRKSRRAQPLAERLKKVAAAYHSQKHRAAAAESERASAMHGLSLERDRAASARKRARDAKRAAGVGAQRADERGHRADELGCDVLSMRRVARDATSAAQLAEKVSGRADRRAEFQTERASLALSSANDLASANADLASANADAEAKLALRERQLARRRCPMRVSICVSLFTRISVHSSPIWTIDSVLESQ